MGAFDQVGLAAVVALSVAGCAVNRQGFEGLSLPPAASQGAAEANLHGVLVGSYHADPEDAACLVTEAFRHKSVNTNPGSTVSISWSKAEFEEFAELCDVDMSDLWRSSD